MDVNNLTAAALTAIENNQQFFLNGAAFIFFIIIPFALIIFFLFWRLFRQATHPLISRARQNPILEPIKENPWESEAVFNPAAILHKGRIHLFYRALGQDGISRIGHASSADGVHFDERSPEPVFVPEIPKSAKFKNPFSSPARLPSYNRALYASGGGWGGSEDPRAVSIDEKIYMTYSSFNGWHSIRLMVTSLNHGYLSNRDWRWTYPSFLSPAGQVHKNWVLFPEKINGKYAILHSISPELQIEYADEIEGAEEGLPIQSTYHPRSEKRKNHWDKLVRGAGAPPIKTSKGWLLFYHAHEPHESHRYKLGAMLLDLKDPTRVLYRSKRPLLEPDMPYENDWKPGIVYVTGAVIKEGILYLYYGGGDKTVNLATAPLDKFLRELTEEHHKETEHHN